MTLQTKNYIINDTVENFYNWSVKTDDYLPPGQLFPKYIHLNENLDKKSTKYIYWGERTVYTTLTHIFFWEIHQTH